MVKTALENLSESGKEVFNADFDEHVTYLNSDGDMLFIGTTGYHTPQVLGVNRNNGYVVFNIPMKPEQSHHLVTSDGKNVFAGGSDSVYAFDLSGTTLWKRNLQDIVEKYTGSNWLYRINFGAIVGNDLICMSTDGDYFKLDKNNGDVIGYRKFTNDETWEKVLDRKLDAIIVNEREKYTKEHGRLLFLDPESGTVTKEHKLESPANDFDLDEKYLYLGDKNGIIVLDKNSLETVAKESVYTYCNNRTIRTPYKSTFELPPSILHISVDEENLYFSNGVSSGDELICLDKLTLHQKWKIKEGSGYMTSQGGTVYVSDSFNSRGDVMGYSSKSLLPIDLDFSSDGIVCNEFKPHPNLDDRLNDAIEKSEKDGGIDVSKLPKNAQIKIHTNDGTFTFSTVRPRKFELESDEGETKSKIYVVGSTWGGSMTKMGFIGVGMFPQVYIENEKIELPMVRDIEVKVGGKSILTLGKKLNTYKN